MAKRKKENLIDWSYSTKLESGKLNKDVLFSYKIENGIKLKTICADAWIYTNNKDRYPAYIQCIISLNNEIIFEGSIESTVDGTAWSSCVYEFNDLVESGIIEIKAAGNNFKKGLNLNLLGYTNE